MSNKPVKKISPMQMGLAAGMIVFVGVAGYIVKGVMNDDSPREKKPIATVTLMKPPPVTIKEKPPELQPPKEMQKDDIIDPGPQNEPQNQNADADNTPAGDSLGVDAEGGAGSDGFGLVGKKGGRSILSGSGGGGFGKMSLLTKFSGYTQIVTTEIRKKVMKRLDDEGGIPKGKLQAVVRVSVDPDGRITDHRIVGSSGNARMDEAVLQSLRTLQISEPPPEGMPRIMNIRITSQG